MRDSSLCNRWNPSVEESPIALAQYAGMTLLIDSSVVIAAETFDGQLAEF